MLDIVGSTVEIGVHGAVPGGADTLLLGCYVTQVRS